MNFVEAERLQFPWMKISGRGSQNFHSRHFQIASQLLGKQRWPTNETGQGSQLQGHGKVAASGDTRVPAGLMNSCTYFVDYDFAGPDLGN